VNGKDFKNSMVKLTKELGMFESLETRVEDKVGKERRVERYGYHCPLFRCSKN
jgi:hypothetical protein